MKLGAGGTAPRILFGAHDRHNFGDLLFGRIALALSGNRPILPAGLVTRDLSCHGGLHVTAIAELARRFRDEPVEIVHIGGEILTTTAWQAAVMLAEPGEANSLIARYDADPVKAQAYAHERFGIAAAAPYLVGRELFPAARRIVCNAVGGADFLSAEKGLRDEVVMKLRDVDELVVRDQDTSAALHSAGLKPVLAPDPAVLTAELFGAEITGEMASGEVADCRRAFAGGFLAVQFSADCGDEHTLTRIATQLDALAADFGWGIVFFRAGAAPWHDDVAAYLRCKARMRQPAWVFESLALWQIIALLAASEGFVGTSLHGRIVTGAFAKPRVSFLPPSLIGRPNKLVAYTASWEMPEMPGVVALESLAEAFARARGVAREALHWHARTLAENYREVAHKVFAA